MPAERIKHLADARWRVAVTLSGVVVAVYFGFILAIAYAKPVMSTIIVPGLSVGILAGALVIVAAWATTWAYIRWANAHYDSGIAEIHAVLRQTDR